MIGEVDGQLDLFDLVDGTLDANEQSARAAQLAEAPRAENVARRTALLAERWGADPLHRVLQPWEQVCGRCGEIACAGGHGNHWLGCPVGVDPVWRYYPKRADGLGTGSHSLELGDRGYHLTVELCIRWDAHHWPDCQCGHPWGVHVRVYGMGPQTSESPFYCMASCGCNDYQEASA